jgi:GTP:adenosylcobinamide-phosphate guanylyltransferase
MNAIVLAGGTLSPDDPLYPYTSNGNKALLDLCGKPMIQWVLDALSGSSLIDQVILIGLPPSAEIHCKHNFISLEDQPNMLLNVRYASKYLLESGVKSELALLVAADIPAITSEMIDWTIQTVQQTDHDLYYSLIERSAMEKRFPGSNRSFYHLRDIEICGGDLNAVNINAMVKENPIWDKLIAARKNAFKQTAIVGLDTLFLFLIRWFDIHRAGPWASKRLGLRAHTFIDMHPETAMDVDKPHQLEIIRADLCGQSAQ